MTKYPPDSRARTKAEVITPRVDAQNPIWGFAEYQIETSRSWGSISVDVVNRAAGASVWRSDYHRIRYLLSDVSGTVQYNDAPVKALQVKINNISFTPSGVAARWNQHAPARHLQILQSHDTYDPFISDMVRGGTVDLQPRDLSNDPLVSQIVLTIANEMEGGFLDRLLVDALNTALSARIMRQFVDPSKMTLEPSNGLSRERLQRVCDYIEAHLGDRLTLTELARVACLSLYHFSRSFKQSVGVGTQRYVMLQRLERAKTLMRRTNQPLALIAQEVGFTDQSHLTSVFRRETGETPGRYRAAIA